MTRTPGVTLTGNETLAELTTSLEFLRCEREMSSDNVLRRRALSDQINMICDAIIDKHMTDG